MIFKINYFEVLESTNSYLKNIISSGHDNNDGVVIIADRQLAGVGKLGRKWQSDKGNLFFSLALKQGNIFDNLKDIGIISLLCSSAVKETIKIFLGDNYNIKCKWPNDILISGEKISGILLEIVYNKSGDMYLVIGIGVNIISSPDINNYKTTYINKYISNKISSMDFANILMECLDKMFISFKENPKNIILQWKNSAYLLGEEIKLKLGYKILKGIFLGVNDNGYLLLKSEDKINTITAGEVFNINTRPKNLTN
jgi:BirA family biotin operon repressor/biotin-[acetyl-CoA-carboxylase] ligase